jgi:hypothetical protein
MRYDGTPDKIGMIPHLTAKLGARETEAGICPPMCVIKKKSAGAIDLQDYSMLFNFN